MATLRAKSEDSVFGELRQKISDFLSILEGYQWRPKKPEAAHHEFVEDLASFLRSTLAALQNKDLARQCYLVAFQHLAARVTELLAASKTIAHVN